MLRRKTNGVAKRSAHGSLLPQVAGKSVERRAFLCGSGLAIGGLAAIGAIGGTVRKAEAAAATRSAVKTIKSVCTHCSVGCTVLSEVADGFSIAQDPGWDRPFQLGAHCA